MGGLMYKRKKYHKRKVNGNRRKEKEFNHRKEKDKQDNLKTNNIALFEEHPHVTVL
jgi:hypothetical protein